MRLALPLVLAAGLTLPALLPAQAEACSPPQAMVTGSTPENGQRWPANAALLFEGYGVYIDGFQATVAGQPARVVAVDGLRSKSNNITGFFETIQAGIRLEPAPRAGQEVVVTWGEACEGCGGYTLRYTASQAVQVPAPAAPRVNFDLAYYDGINIDGATCYYLEDLTYAWHLDLKGDAPGGYPVALNVTPLSTAGGEALYTQTHFEDGEGVSAAYYGDSASVTGEPAAESLCFTVTAQDLFGQRSAPTTACLPCNIARPDPGIPYGVDGNGDPIYGGLPPEPDWATEGDPYCGGPCDTGAGCAEEEEEGPGPGCATSPVAGVSLAGLLLLGALGVRRREEEA